MSQVYDYINKTKQQHLMQAKEAAKQAYSKNLTISKELQNEIAEIAKNNNYKLVSDRATINYLIGVMCINRALDEHFTPGTKPTMTEIIVNTFGDLPTLSIENMRDIRQLVYLGYRITNNLNAGLEYNPYEFIKECEPTTAQNLFVACELLSRKRSIELTSNENTTQPKQINLTVSTKEKVLASTILENKPALTNIGEKYENVLKSMASDVNNICMDLHRKK